MVVLFLKRLFPCLLIEERGSLVMEGVVVFPVVMVLLFSFISFINYFSVSSYIRQRVDSYGVYVSSVGGVVVDGIGEVGVPNDLLEVGAGWGSSSYLRSYLLKEGVLDNNRLVVVSDFDGGYMTVRVEYGVDVVLFGRVVVVDFYERRFW